MEFFEYDKNAIKNNLTMEQVNDLLAELGAEPIVQNDIIVSKTICHCGQSHKLYYYDNTKLFRCYTDCGGDAFDLFELILKHNNYQGAGWQLPQAIEYVAEFFGFSPTELQEKDLTSIEDWKILNSYNRIKDIDKTKRTVELKYYDDTILKNLPRAVIEPWIKEDITMKVMDKANIKYDPKNCGVVIPHYDINNNLIGIRERTLVKEKEKYGKYRPAYINGKMYNHPLSFNLYNLNNSKDNIKAIKKAIIFEGEKSCLHYASYYGIENDISVAVCGNSLLQYQVDLLMKLGVKEIIIAFDKQFKTYGDNEFIKLTKNLEKIQNKYGTFVNFSFMFDKNNLLGYKCSPIDCGKEIFEEMLRERVILN